MEVQLIRLEKHQDTKVELVRDFLYIYCFTKNIKLSNSELTTLAFFIVYGYSEQTQELVIRSNVVSAVAMKNVLSKLRKNKLLDNKELFEIKSDRPIAILVKCGI